MQSFDNIQECKAYLDMIKEFKKKNISLAYNKKEFKTVISMTEGLESIIELSNSSINNIDEEDKYSIEELDDILMKKLSSIFNKVNILRVLKLANTKCIAQSNYSYLMDGKIYLSKYENLSDIITVINLIMYYVMNDIGVKYKDSFYIPYGIEIILADSLNDYESNCDYLKKYVLKHIADVVCNLDLVKKFKKITPIVAPFITAEVLSYEMFLRYLLDKEKFLKYFNDLVSYEINIQNFLDEFDMNILEDDKFIILENQKQLILQNW